MLDKSKRCIATLLVAAACIFTPCKAFADWPTEETATLMGWLSSINGNQQLILGEIQLIYDDFNENTNGTIGYYLKGIYDQLNSNGTTSIKGYLSKIAANSDPWSIALTTPLTGTAGQYLYNIHHQLTSSATTTVRGYLSTIASNANPWNIGITSPITGTSGQYLYDIWNQLKSSGTSTVRGYLSTIATNANPWNISLTQPITGTSGQYFYDIWYQLKSSGTTTVRGYLATIAANTANGGSGGSGGSSADLSTIESILGNLAFVQDDGLQYLATIGNADQEFADYLDGLNSTTYAIFQILDAFMYHGTALDVYVTNPSGGSGGSADLSTIERLLGNFTYYNGGILKVHDEGVYDNLSALGTIANNIHNVVRSITGQITDIINYLKSSSTADQAIGEFDWQAYGRNAQSLTERLSAIAPFGAIALLSALIAIWSQSGAASFTPAADLPFNFLPGSNQQVHIDLSYFSSIQPVVDLFFLSMLLMALISASMRVVELEAAS